MVNRRRSAAEETSLSAEIVTTEPQLVPPARYSARHKFDVFLAVDYLGTRFRTGDHVAMYTGEGKEWICVLETLYRDPESGEAKFKGRWFWSMKDVMEAKQDRGEELRPSKCPEHELICCDNRDTNLVESISRKCVILSYENFELVRKVVTKSNSPWKKTYYCERQYYHRVHRFSELSSLLFPGDPIPPELRSAAGLPEPLPPAGEDVQETDGYREPPFATNAVRKRSKESSDETAMTGDPIFFW